MTNSIVPVFLIITMLSNTLNCTLPASFFRFFVSLDVVSFCVEVVVFASFLFFLGGIVGVLVTASFIGGNHLPATNLSSRMSISLFVPREICLLP